MELKEAIKRCYQIINDSKEIIKEARKNGDINLIQLTADLDNQSIAIETVLQKLEKLHKDNYKLDKENQKLFESQINSIPKKKIEDKIEELKEIKTKNGDVYVDVILEIKILKELLENK